MTYPMVSILIYIWSHQCTVDIDVVLVQKKIFFAFEKNPADFSDYPTIFCVEKTLLETFFPIPPLKGFFWGPPVSPVKGSGN